MSAPDLRTVVLKQYPTAIGVAAKQHNDELVREFTIIAAGRDQGSSSPELPARLISVMDTIRRQYGAGLEDRDARLFAAVEAGIEHIDVEMQLPPAAADAARHLGEVLDEADEFCRSGQHLLTIATPPHLLRFRRWYFNEVIGQLAGAAPTPWPAHEDVTPA